MLSTSSMRYHDEIHIQRIFTRPVLFGISTFFVVVLLINHVWYSWGLFATVRVWNIPSLTLPQHPTEISTLPTAYTAAVIYLVSFKRSSELILSLSYLKKNLPMHPWPIVLFHVEDFADAALQTQFKTQLFSYLGSTGEAWNFVQRIQFESLDWELPSGVSHDKTILKPVFADRWPGYHHMCRFFATQIFSHPRLQNFTYYLRMDTDSFIYEAACSDPLEIMHAKNRSYGFRSLSNDPPKVTHDMWPFVSSYAIQHQDIEQRLTSNGWMWPGGQDGRKMDMSNEPFPVYYNNFEIVKLDAFRRPDISTWLDEIMADPERIYKWRWGDAPLRYATVNMFFDVERDVEQFCDIRYHHQKIQYPICDCKTP